MTRRVPARRAAFTLIELLVVIAIIGVLIGLLLPAVQYVRVGGQRTQAKSEIEQLGVSIGNYKAKFFNGGGYIPAFGGGTANNFSSAPFRLCSTYHDPAGNWLPWPEVTYLKQVFPQMEMQQVNGVFDNGLRLNGQPIPNTNPQMLDPNQCLVFFLTGGPFTGNQGFSNNKIQPFLAPASTTETRIGPFLDVKQDKFDSAGRYKDPWGTPYAYFTAINGNDYGGTSAVMNVPNIDGNAAGPVVPYFSGTGANLKFFNQKSFQIISAGRDKFFGIYASPPGARPTGIPTAVVLNSYGAGAWNPGQGDWTSSRGPGADDLSNFNAGQLVASN